MFESDNWDRICPTCGGDVQKARVYDTQSCFCSYWCHLVENGPAFYTLEIVSPWLKANRPPIESRSAA
jgi:hypothetical protein